MTERLVGFCAVAVVLGVLFANPAMSASEIRYLVWNQEEERALVQSPAGKQWVVVGDPVADLGNVASISETHIVLNGS